MCIRDRHGKLSSTEKKFEEYEFKYSDAAKTVSSLCTWIEALYNNLECSKVVSKEFQGGQGVTESNLMSFLGVIEERVNYILSYYSQITTGGKNFDFMQNTNMMSTTQTKMKQDIPSFLNDDLEDDDIESDKPLTLEEFRQKALEKLYSKEKQNSKGKRGVSKSKRK
eukprot:TRINITY_DN8766_c0_g1_i5.p3 TRINITY_DN8766_c0_g1~~TRINITY_DN8766_c0_g1_i5.p3  ORF type:complete len:167 (+),score=38.97 TRINITY_DN8766_c0_g1_i5:65-565(+)